MYYSTPACGGQITPCTDPKLRAKGELDLVAVAAVGRNEGAARTAGSGKRVRKCKKMAKNVKKRQKVRFLRTFSS